MKIAITSGKGGTGKTTVSTGLFQVLTSDLKHPVQLLDCDVEEPDCRIFIKAKESFRYSVNLSVPEIDTESCIWCGKCKAACNFNAILMIPASRYIEIIEDLCHGCGTCSFVCPKNAIHEKKIEIGKITHFFYKGENDFVEGRMKVGNVMQTRVIRETLNHAAHEKLILYDSPPGTSCPVVATISKSDFVIMVTEPTPFGLHDLKLLTDTVNRLDKKGGIIVNKSGFAYRPLYEFIHHNHIPLLGEIPFRKELALDGSKGMIITEMNADIKNIFKKIIQKILNGKTFRNSDLKRERWNG